MDTLAKSDMFFFITTICILLVSLVLLVVGAYVIVIIADIRMITKKLREGTDEVVDDLKLLRENLKEKGRTFGSVLAAIFALRRARKKSKKD